MFGNDAGDAADFFGGGGNTTKSADELFGSSKPAAQKSTTSDPFGSPGDDAGVFASIGQQQEPQKASDPFANGFQQQQQQYDFVLFLMPIIV